MKREYGIIFGDMIEFSETQKKTIASGLTILSLVITFAFVAVVAWGVLSLLSFASSALIPVILGFFLALFPSLCYNTRERFV